MWQFWVPSVDAATHSTKATSKFHPISLSVFNCVGCGSLTTTTSVVLTNKVIILKRIEYICAFCLQKYKKKNKKTNWRDKTHISFLLSLKNGYVPLKPIKSRIWDRIYTKKYKGKPKIVGLPFHIHKLNRQHLLSLFVITSLPILIDLIDHTNDS